MYSVIYGLHNFDDKCTTGFLKCMFGTSDSLLKISFCDSLSSEQW